MREDIVNLSKMDVPFIAFNGAHLEFFGNRKMVYEGKYTIIEYSEITFRIKTGKQEICINGTQLELCQLEADRFVLVGKFTSCSFE